MCSLDFSEAVLDLQIPTGDADDIFTEGSNLKFLSAEECVSGVATVSQTLLEETNF